MGEHILRRCPNALLSLSYVSHAVELYAAYKRGILPKEGGLAAQTACYRQTMALLASHETAATEWYAAERKAKKGEQDGTV